jgi:hypothetical protein
MHWQHSQAGWRLRNMRPAEGDIHLQARGSTMMQWCRRWRSRVHVGLEAAFRDSVSPSGAGKICSFGSERSRGRHTAAPAAARDHCDVLGLL